jgi:prepilin-type N-terminal cleavage/methylation domain-containing protein/prepilin-type processing-associated H-X9-DG protein
MFRVSLRLIVAAMSTLAAAAILYWAQADPVPHDASARVTSAAFWSAMSRPVAAQRPSDIVVYPPRRGVQLVTCVGHPVGAAQGVWKYLYVSTPAGKPLVEARLKGLGVAFRTPWQEAAWVRSGPWAAFTLAVVLVAWGWAAALMKVLGDATAKRPAPQAIAAPVPQVAPADLKKVRELEEAMEMNLAGTSAAPATQMPAAAPPVVGAPAVLRGGPLEQIEKPAEKEKDYKGEYYPVARPKEHGFSIIELLVVIGILGVLIALLLPTLSGARRDANAIACGANLRSIAQGLGVYEVDNNGCIPSSYSYTGQTVVNGQQTFSALGYHHWSYFIYKSGLAPSSAFMCPELNQGGLPPTNTTSDNLLPGQMVELSGAIDEQTPRLAYTLNEALSPRNKFTLGFQGAKRVYQFVRAASVPNSSGTILATEWADNAARFAAIGSSFYVYSHRPVHGFVGLDGTLDMYALSQSVPYRRVTAADLDPDPGAASSSTTRLDWVGRNHGRKTGYPDERRSNFLYLDGHVECKTIYETLQPFEWGEKFFTLSPNDDLQQP